MSSDKTLIILRHAHRDKSLGRELDNGLSKKGISQSKKIAEHLNKNFKNKIFTLVSSPKKRCKETLLPFSILLQNKIKTLSCLNEGYPLEPKIYEFLYEFKKQNSEIFILCSHGDWIPEFLEHAIHCRVELKKGGLVIIKYKNEKFELIEIIQKL